MGDDMPQNDPNAQNRHKGGNDAADDEIHQSGVQQGIGFDGGQGRGEDGDNLALLNAHAVLVTGKADILVGPLGHTQHNGIGQAIGIANSPGHQLTGGEGFLVHRIHGFFGGPLRIDLMHVFGDLGAPGAPYLAGIVDVAAAEPVVEDLDADIVGIVRALGHDIDDQSMQRRHLVQRQAVKLAFQRGAFILGDPNHGAEHQGDQTRPDDDHEAAGEPQICPDLHRGPFLGVPRFLTE